MTRGAITENDRRAARPPGRRVLQALASAALVSTLAGCGGGILDPKGPIGAADRTLLLDSLFIMLVIVVPTIIAVFAFAWWFRAGNPRARYLPDWEFSGQIEMVVWAIPAMTIVLLGGVTWIGAHELDPGKPIESKTAPLDIEVVSLDWKWLFIYPKEGIASVNKLVVPAGVPLHFSITSASVLNTFFVPQLGSMIYAMNGMQTELHLQADEPGTYRGLSGHFSGDGFSDMHFTVEAMPAAQWSAWQASVRGQGDRLDATRYRALSAQGTSTPLGFGSVEPGLFEKVVTLALPPAPGPAPAVGGRQLDVPAQKTAAR